MIWLWFWIVERNAEGSTESQGFTEKEWAATETAEEEKWGDSCCPEETEDRVPASHSNVSPGKTTYLTLKHWFVTVTGFMK